MIDVPHQTARIRPWFVVFCLGLCLQSRLDLSATAPDSGPKEPDSYHGASEPTTPAQWYGQDVRQTTWKSPAEEARGFHLPPGFSVELVAAEPDIAKPLNMAFDHRGRLWVTCTVEYPYPATGEPEVGVSSASQDGSKIETRTSREKGPGRDTIKILEDSNGDGQFDSIKTFADGLNIPIGILPVGDGALCFSIPYIWHLQDLDGDDQVDRRVPLLGPFDTTRDTHGMINSLRMGWDGWVYACHGFNNRSDVTAADGSSVQMNSGNTFRFLPDGSRIELYTRGQVNPFGMTCDQWGNWYTADCHSKPLTALLPGACYPSFSLPHDGLGFAPSMMDHLHGSTAICGVEYYQGLNFPAAYRHLFYSGNVMTCRINCNAPNRSGMTVRARELPDFLTSDDPWFRPVDLRVGPDGCLYIADFYNGIIGHYEVPLDHPGRDRHSGRIWRVRYNAPREESSRSSPATASLDGGLSSDNYSWRRQSIELELVHNSLQFQELRSIASDIDQPLELRSSAIEILARRRQLTQSLMQSLLRDGPPALQVLTLKIASGFTPAPKPDDEVILASAELLTDEHAEVGKASIDLLRRAGDSRCLPKLLQLAQRSGPDDPVQVMAVRIAIRDILQREPAAIERISQQWVEDLNAAQSLEARLLVELMPGISSPLAAKAMLRYLTRFPGLTDSSLTTMAIEHCARHPSEDMLAMLMDVIIRATERDYPLRASRLIQIADSLTLSVQRPSPGPLAALAEQTQVELLRQLVERLEHEGSSSVWLDAEGNSWRMESRQCSDGQSVELMSSLTLGERYVGTLISEPFACPPALKLWIAGHNGFPDQPDHLKNSIRLIATRTGRTFADAIPPRNDIAAEVEWDLSQFVGEEVQLHIIDGDNGAAFAWIGVGRFSEPALRNDSTRELLQSIEGLVRRGFAVPSVSQVLDKPLSNRQRASLIASLLDGSGKGVVAVLARQAISVGRPELITPELIHSDLSPQAAKSLAEELCRSSTTVQQSKMARELLTSIEGCEMLADMLDAGWVNRGSLRGVTGLLPDSLDPGRRRNLQSHLEAAQQAGMDTALVGQRLAELDWRQADESNGQLVFKQHCGNCHQLSGQGAVVGPQLDGAVHRAVERLAEDILLPNINVDRAFRVTNLLLEDGSIVSGQIQNEDAETIHLVDTDGKTFTVKAIDVSERRQSDQSLMPSNFSELLTAAQLADLLHFLRSTSHSLPSPGEATEDR